MKNAINLRYVTLPDTIETIGNSAFEGCKGLPFITLNIGLKDIGNYAFANCDGLITLTIPGTVSRIGESAFAENQNIISVTMLDGVETIEKNAFKNCSELKEVFIPDSVQSFGNDIFAGCDKLTIHCSQNSQAAIYAISHGIAVEFYKDETNDTTVIDSENSGYELAVSNAMANGYISGTVKYSVKEAEVNNISDFSVSIKFPSNTQIMYETLKCNSSYISDYSVEEDVLTIPVESSQGTITFCLKPEINKKYDTFALFNYKKDGKSYSDIIGVISQSIPTLSINTEDTVSVPSVLVSGVAPVSSDVKIELNGKIVKTVQSSKNGKYETKIDLEDPKTGDYYEISANVVDEEDNDYTVSTAVVYIADEPKLTRFDMYYNNHQDAKKDLLNDVTQGQPLSFNPAYPFKFVVGFDNDENIENVAIESNKNGIIKTIDAVYDPASKTYVASGYFGGQKNYVPGALSVVYNKAKSGVSVTQDLLEKINNQVFRKEIDNAATSVVGIDDDGTVRYKTIFDNPMESIFGREELETSVKVFDGLNKTEFEDIFALYDSYDYYLNTKSDRYWVRVVENAIEDPASGTPGLLILIGDTLDNSVTQFFMRNMLNLADTKLVKSSVGMLGNAALTVFKVAGTAIDAERMKDSVLHGDYSEEQKEALLNEIDAYEKMCVIYNLLACLGALSITAAGGPVGAVVAYAVLTYFGDTFFEEWKNSLELGYTWFAWIVDPSGYVYEGVTENRLKGVKVTIYYKDESGKPVQWDAENYLQDNPLYTDSDGVYAWDVPEGQWQVRYEKEGYEPAVSEWYDVPPIQTDVNIGMISEESLEIQGIHLYEDHAVIIFNQYVSKEGLDKITVLDEENHQITFTAEYPDEGKDMEGNTFVKTCILRYTNGKKTSKGDQYTVALPDVLSYTGKVIKESNLNVTAEAKQSIEVESKYNVSSGKEIKIQGRVLNGLGNETIECIADNQNVVNCLIEKQPDQNGNFVIAVKGMILGETDIQCTITGTDIAAIIHVNVEQGEAQEPEPHVHTWDKGKITKPASCEETGIKTYTCSGCGNTYTEEIAKTAHKWDSGVITKEATCTENGVKKYTCSICGNTQIEKIAKSAHVYREIVTKATTNRDGAISSVCTACGAKERVNVIAFPQKITLERDSYVYDGKVKNPSVKVVGRDGEVISNSNYTVAYSGGKDVGTYQVMLIFKNNYSGSVTRSFSIIPKGVKIKKPKAAKKSMTVRWAKQSGKMSKLRISGYQIQYSTSEKFKKAKTKKVTQYSKTMLRIKKLKTKKKYFVRIRSYMKVAGQTYYSPWSKTKKVKIK